MVVLTWAARSLAFGLINEILTQVEQETGEFLSVMSHVVMGVVTWAVRLSLGISIINENLTQAEHVRISQAE